MKENIIIYNLITFIAAAFFFLPFCVLLYKKKLKHPFFSWFAYYWVFGGLVNLLFLLNLFRDKELSRFVSDLFNIADVLIMLFLLYYTLTIEKLRRILKYILLAFIILTVSGLAIRGFDEAITAVVGSGVSLVVLSLTGIVVYFLSSTNKQLFGSSRLMLYCALLFEYSVSVITFLFSYIFPNKTIVSDNFLIFHLSVIVATILGSFAIAFTRKQPAKKPAEQLPKEEVEIQFL
ncbi:MAG: hypothetical protein KIT80_12345 [Chitinophagaceae bacterium]|nr:hypothetical protein [Chitinophagaceae bacterium]MCW5927693.1 hypothetical protein [Chitinophagaceae bacterium]